MHVQVKSWSGARGGSNGCHCWRCAARATVLAVCCVSVLAVLAVIMAAPSLPQRPIIHCNPSSTGTHRPSSTSNNHPRPQLHIISRHKDIHFPATILLPAGRWLPVWRELSSSSFGRGAGWECPVATENGVGRRNGWECLGSLVYIKKGK